MELPRQRPFGAQGRKPTHDFLSLYSHPTVQPDLKPPSQGGSNLKTQDFLQPLERAETAAKEEGNFDITAAEKPPPPPEAPPLLPTSVERILPGGIGTYSISHISSFNQKVAKPEGGVSISAAGQGSSADRNDENSNCSSYTGSGFTLWEESAIKKGKTGKENIGERSNFVIEAASKAAEWTSSEMPCLSSSNNLRNSFSSLSSSYQPRNQSFMDMIKSAKGGTLEDDLDDEEEFVLKRESPSPINQGELRVKVDRKSSDQKANTPRSKHSATEQRRRSKINDRFQMLREIIPHGDQKRDKASFLLEVIEYIQFLQVKVQKYEGSCQGWTDDPPKLAPWRNSSGPAESYIDPSRGVNGDGDPPFLVAAKSEEKNVGHSPAVGITQSLLESEVNAAAIFKPIDQHSTLANKLLSFPMTLQPNIFHSARTSGAVNQQLPRMAPDTENSTEPQTQSCRTKSSTSDEDVAPDKQKAQELTVEGGTISISNVYSDGLLNSLPQALKNSGVDLSKGSISVQIDLAKRAPSRKIAFTPSLKDMTTPSVNQGTTWPRGSGGIESDQAFKKLKTSKS